MVRDGHAKTVHMQDTCRLLLSIMANTMSCKLLLNAHAGLHLHPL